MSCYWFNTKIDFPSLDDLSDHCETDEEYDEWMQTAYEACREIIGELNCDSLSFVSAGAADILSGSKEDKTKRIDVDDAVRIQKELEENKDLDRVYVDLGISSEIANQEIGNIYYIYTFKIYVRDHKDPYWFKIYGGAKFDEWEFCGYPATQFYSVLFHNNGREIHNLEKLKNIVGWNADYRTCLFDKILEEHGYQSSMIGYDNSGNLHL